jgi:hypothetical protein
VARELVRWMQEPGFTDVKNTLWKVLPPFTSADGQTLDILGMWLAPGASAALDYLPLPMRRSIACQQLRGYQEQDWSKVIPIVVAAQSSEELLNFTLEAGTESAATAMLEHLRSTRALAALPVIDSMRHWSRLQSPRLRALLDLTWDSIDRDALQRDTETLRKALLLLSGDHLHLVGLDGGPQMPFERNIWGLVTPEIWRQWWEQRSLPRDILLAMAKVGAKGGNADPCVGLGRLTAAALEFAGRDREPVLATLRSTRSDWLFLLKIYTGAVNDEERRRAAAMMADIDPQWQQTIIRGFIGNGMIQGNWTKPFAVFIQRHPEGLTAVLAAGPTPVKNGAVVPSREVMMCYEMGPDIIPVTMRLASNASAEQATRFNAQILLRVFLMENPQGSQRYQAAIKSMLKLE